MVRLLGILTLVLAEVVGAMPVAAQGYHRDSSLRRHLEGGGRSLVPGTGAVGTSGCPATLMLELRPRPIPGLSYRNGPPARDIPPRPLTVHLPVYPTAMPSYQPIAPDGVSQIFPPAYRKVAVAEFSVAVGYGSVAAWYRRTLPRCGLWLDVETPLQRHGGFPFAGLGFFSRDGLRMLSLTFRPVTPGLTLVRYDMQALDLPPRPADSFLHGPFVRVSVLYQSSGVLPSSQRTLCFTVTWPATIARLVAAVNRPAQIFVSGLGGGGGVVFSESAVLTFVRADGGARRVRVGGVLIRLIVGHTRPLDDSSGLLRVVDRLVAHRCGHARTCA